MEVLTSCRSGKYHFYNMSFQSRPRSILFFFFIILLICPHPQQRGRHILTPAKTARHGFTRLNVTNMKQETYDYQHNFCYSPIDTKTFL